MAVKYSELRENLNFSESELKEIEEIKAGMMEKVRICKLGEVRREAGLTQEQVAKKIGVSQRQVSYIENGNLEKTTVSVIRRYIEEGLGGKLKIELALDGIGRAQLI